MFGQRIDDLEDKFRWGKENSRQDLYPNEHRQNPEDRIMSRWYNEEGWAIHDRDYSDHGDANAHPIVPHDHTFNWKHRLGFPERSSKSFEPSQDFCS
jgi:hypothetical protein